MSFFTRGLLQLRGGRSYRVTRTSSFIAVTPATPWEFPRKTKNFGARRLSNAHAASL